MPKIKTDLTPAEYAVLGVLREHPAHGYELKGRFAGTDGLGRVCPIETGMVYAILRSLSGLDLIDGTWDGSSTPRRSVYAVTDEGAQVFERWLRRPVTHLREVRFDFMVKLYFALREDRDLARDLVAAQIAVIEDYAQDTDTERAVCPAGTEEFDAIVLDSQLSGARATLDWLGRVRQQIDRPLPTVK